MNTYIETLRNSGWVVRVILATIGNDPDKKENYSFIDHVTQIAASVTTTYGLNHTALQIGPYYIHYTTSNLISFHDVEQKQSAFAMLYPVQNFSITFKNTPQLLALCSVIIDFNSRQYNTLNNNCHDFVETVLDAIGCPQFPKKGPIANFLKLVRTSNTGVNHMRIKDLHEKLVEFDAYEAFAKYCQQEEIKQVIRTPPANLTVEQDQFLQVLKAVERGFQIQQPLHKQIPREELVFSAQDSSSLLHSTVDKITKFVPSKRN